MQDNTPKIEEEINVTIQSHNKDEDGTDEEPIDEMGELINDLHQKLDGDHKDMLTDTLPLDPKQELFEFKSFLNQSYRRQETDICNNDDLDSPTSGERDLTPEIERPVRTLDPTKARKFNPKNIQQAKKMNK